MTGKHTPEPWAIDKRARNHVIATERSICSCSWSDSSLPDSGMGENNANARRITLCINALAGISNEALEEGVIGKLREDLQSMVRIVEAYRYSAGLGKHQTARLERAKATLALLDKE